MAAPILWLSFLLGATTLFASATAPSASCGTRANSTRNGVCVTYPNNGLCGSNYWGKPVWLPNGTSTQEVDEYILGFFSVLVKNSAEVEASCKPATEKFLCMESYPPCFEVNGEAIPQLSCQHLCEEYWAECSQAFNTYYQYTVEILQIISVEQVALKSCGLGTFAANPQPSDRFGQRVIPDSLTYAEGYRGELRFPFQYATYTFENGTSFPVSCQSVASQILPHFSLELQCTYPLIAIRNRNGTEECVIPCPFPIIPLNEQLSIGLSFVIPALLALALCAFVFVDSLWEVFLAKGGPCYDRLRKLLSGTVPPPTTTATTKRVENAQQPTTMAKTMLKTNNGGGSYAAGTVTMDSAAVANMAEHEFKRSSKTHKLQPTTLYGLLGSSLGIAYFCVGPLLTMLRYETISCNAQGYFELKTGGDVGGRLIANDPSDDMCKAQRIAPFLLQAMFNLILYALVQVLMLVSSVWKKRVNKWVHLGLLLYCVLGPVFCCALALGLDDYTRDLLNLFGELARNSAICTVRLTVLQEIVLVFIPFLWTGMWITLMSLYIWTHLSTIRKNVQSVLNNNNSTSGNSGVDTAPTGPKNKKKTSQSHALSQFMVRLSILGILTFVVLLILLGATGYIMNAMATFSPLFNTWFLCETTGTSCNRKNCPDYMVAKDEATPRFEAFAVQIFSMSAISLLFGGFFAAQSFARLMREYRSGVLLQKIGNIWDGMPLDYVAPEVVHNNTNSDEPQSPTQHGGKHVPGSYIGGDQAKSAYMAAPFDGGNSSEKE